MNYFKLLNALYTLKKNTKKTRKQIEILQNKKLRDLLVHAYNHSDYYHSTFQEVGITEENIYDLPLSSFPTINKNQLIKHFNELVTKSDLKQEDLQKFDQEESINQKSFKNQYHVVHSSGSTGEPRYFVYDNEAWDEMLVGIIRAALWNMSMSQILKLLIQGPRIVYIAATDGRYGGAMAVGAGVDGLHAHQLFLDIKTPLDEWGKSIHEFKPNILIGYPSAIKILGELVESEQIQMNVKRVISCGEPVSINLRLYLEKVFDTKVVNIYGASESLALGVETDYTEGLHLFDDLNYIEVEDGNMYLTSLYNYAQPLIRYHISDQLKLKEYNDKYPFANAYSLLGRNEDILWFEDDNGNKEFLHSLAVEGFCIAGLLDYQFRQTSHNSFEMIAEISHEGLKESMVSEMNKQMHQMLQEKNLNYVQFYVRFVDEILPDPKTGKKKLIVK